MEYLDYVAKYPCPLSFVRGHMFKMLNHVFQVRTNHDLREIIAKSHSLEEFREAVEKVRDRYIVYHEGNMEFIEPEELELFNLKHPVWICQPYVRPPPDVYLEKMRKLAEKERKDREELVKTVGVGEKRTVEQPNQLSKKKQKKLERNPWKGVSKGRENTELCCGIACKNPCSLKCSHSRCKRCCKEKAFVENLDCEGHRVFIRSNREKAKQGGKEKEGMLEDISSAQSDAGDINENL